MKRTRQVALSIVLLLTPCLLMFVVSLQAGQTAPPRQSSPTVVVTLTTVTLAPSAASPSLTPIPTLESVSYPQMLAVYKEVLTSSKWIVTVFLGILTLSGLGALWLYQQGLKGMGEVLAKANELKSELEKSKKQSEEMKSSSEKLEKELEKQSEEARNLWKQLESIWQQAKSAQQEIKEVVHRYETVAAVDIYGMRLFRTEKRTSRVARRTLIELSKDPDPVVRRECVRVFGAIPDFPEHFIDQQDRLILTRLREMAFRDPEPGVQLEARSVLEKFGVDLTHV